MIEPGDWVETTRFGYPLVGRVRASTGIQIVVVEVGDTCHLRTKSQCRKLSEHELMERLRHD